MVPFNTEGLYELRTIVLLETAPQSNKYNKIAFNKEQFKALTAFLSKEVMENGGFTVGDDNIKLPEDIQSIDFYN